MESSGRLGCHNLPDRGRRLMQKKEKKRKKNKTIGPIFSDGLVLLIVFSLTQKRYNFCWKTRSMCRLIVRLKMASANF